MQFEINNICKPPGLHLILSGTYRGQKILIGDVIFSNNKSYKIIQIWNKIRCKCNYINDDNQYDLLVRELN